MGLIFKKKKRKKSGEDKRLGGQEFRRESDRNDKKIAPSKKNLILRDFLSWLRKWEKRKGNKIKVETEKKSERKEQDIAIIDRGLRLTDLPKSPFRRYQPGPKESSNNTLELVIVVE